MCNIMSIQEAKARQYSPVFRSARLLRMSGTSFHEAYAAIFNVPVRSAVLRDIQLARKVLICFTLQASLFVI